MALTNTHVGATTTQITIHVLDDFLSRRLRHFFPKAMRLASFVQTDNSRIVVPELLSMLVVAGDHYPLKGPQW